MVFANEYKLIYAKGDHIYASKSNYPTAGDLELCAVADLAGKDLRAYKGTIYKLVDGQLSPVVSEKLNTVLHAHKDTNDDGKCDADNVVFNDGKEKEVENAGTETDNAEDNVVPDAKTEAAEPTALSVDL